MEIKNVEFIKSCADKKGIIVSDLPKIVVAGKSNVGKSTFINYVCNNSKLARTSNTPGRTRLINYFLLDEKVFFIDLPGYGYAKGSKREVNDWGKLMDDFFKETKEIKRVIMLVDIRHEPTREDVQFMQYLNFYQLPFSVIATKADKLSKVECIRMLGVIASCLKIGIGDIFAVSAEKRIGKEKILDLLDNALKSDI